MPSLPGLAVGGSPATSSPSCDFDVHLESAPYTLPGDLEVDILDVVGDIDVLGNLTRCTSHGDWRPSLVAAALWSMRGYT